jgi:threonyl-tRNA synthetase
MMVRSELGMQIQNACGINIPEDVEFAIRVTKEFYNKNKKFLTELVKSWGKPTLIEMWNERFFYFVMKYEWNFVDALGKASTLNTDQMDVENAERYGIVYTDKDGGKKHPVIMHLSPSGAIERIMYALLEKAHMEQEKGKVPVFPLWLSPVQVRVVPVSSEKHLDFAKELLEVFEKEGIRVDLDDREESVGKRIRASGVEWVPYTLVVGDEEVGGSKLTARNRYTNDQRKVTKEELIKEIKKKVEGMPFRKLSLPKYLSMRPTFRSSN